jgi:hypothetical protein
MRVKRLWSFYDHVRARRFYADILELPPEDRKRLVRQYTRFLKQIRGVRRAMSDYFAGQKFFDFYAEAEEEAPKVGKKKTAQSHQQAGRASR